MTSRTPSARPAWKQGALALRMTPISAAVSVLLLSAGAAQAQSGAQTVTVTGIRHAIETAIAVKRDADGVVEAITSEDLGKLPDVSIAESLARLPGLAGQRVNGSTQEISIRGMSPRFGITLLNGREMVTGGNARSVEFDQFPAELLSGATVYKSPTAGLGAQGLSGTVDLKTVRPLSFAGRQVALNARYEKNSNGEQVPGLSGNGERISVAYIDQFAGKTLGVALGFAHLKSPEEQQHYQNWWWTNMAKYPGSWCGGSCASTGVATDAVALQGFEATAFSATKTRDGLMGVIEYKPNKDLHTTVDLYYTKYKKQFVGREFQQDGFNTAWSGVTIRNAVYENWDGEKVLTGGIADGVLPKLLSRRNQREDKIAAIGINNELKLGNWTATADLSYSKAERDESTGEAYAGPGASSSLAFTIRRNDVSLFTPSVNYADPATMQMQENWGQMASTRLFTVADEVKTFKLAAKRDLSWGPFSRFEAGLNIVERSKDYEAIKYAWDLKSGAKRAPFPSGLLMAPATIGFGAIPQVLSFDVQQLLDTGLLKSRLDDLSSAPDRIWGVSETIVTAYMKADLDFKLGSVPVRGNTGLQFVRSKQTGSGLRWQDNAAHPISGGASYDDVLPSLNLTAELSRNTLLRLGLGRQMARPNMEDMRAGITGIGRSQTGPGLWSARGGNPKLEPWRADALDLSFEHYLDKRSYVAIAGFYKNLKSTIYNEAVPYDFTGFPDPCKPSATSTCTAILTTLGTVTAPSNGNGGNVHGIELSAALDAGRWVKALDGFGVIGSASFTTSNIHHANNLSNPLEGLSGKVTSLVLYYEKGGFQTRIGQRYRSRYLAAIRNIWGDTSYTTIEPERITDFQIGYGWDKGVLKGVSVLFQVNNLTNEPYRTMGSVSDETGTVPKLLYPINFDRYGRQYLLGVSYKY